MPRAQAKTSLNGVLSKADYIKAVKILGLTAQARPFSPPYSTPEHPFCMA